MSEVLVCAEVAVDADAVDDVVGRAFAPLPGAGAGERGLVRALRAAGDVDVALVAVVHAAVVGHVLFSRLSASGVRLTALAPVSVHPAWQLRGIGARLIEAGHAALVDAGVVDGAVVLGHPGYYPRFGYDAARAARHVRTPYDGPHLMLRLFRPWPAGVGVVDVAYAAAFG
jgi:putative acetyltransferase